MVVRNGLRTFTFTNQYTHTMKAQTQFLNDLYVNHYNEVVGFLRSKVGCTQTAEDLAQDVFLKIANNYGHTLGYDPEKGKLKNWLYNYVWHILTDHWRTDKSPRNNYVDGIEGDESGKFEFKNTLGDEENIDVKDVRKKTRKLIYESKLKSTHREMAILYYSLNLGQQEISDFMEIPLGTVNVTIMRIKSKLQSQSPTLLATM